MNKILFSVITVVRNDVGNIRRTIESVLAQNRDLLEYVIVDGGSTDGTVEIIEEYSNSVHQFISEPDTGIYNAMNKGAKIAKGSFLIFMNSGDVFVDAHVLEKVSEFKQIYFADVIYGNVLIDRPSLGIYEKHAESPRNHHRMYFCHQSSFISKRSMAKYMFDEKYKMSADFKQMKLLYLDKATFLKLQFPISHFDKNGISNTQRVKGMRENISIIKECDRGLIKIKLLFRILPSFFIASLKS